MDRYFFHFRDSSVDLSDGEGVELPNLEAAESAALVAARDTLSHDIRNGKIDLGYRIDVENADGTLLYSLALEDSFSVARGRQGTISPVGS